MFKLFKKKNKLAYQKLDLDTLISQNSTDSVSLNVLSTKDGFPRFSFDEIKQLTEDGNHEAINKLASDDFYYHWIRDVSHCLGEAYSIYESDDFVLVSAANEKYVSQFLKSMESFHHRIGKALGELHRVPAQKLVILIIEEHNQYYEYISYYYPSEGSFAQSGGSYLNDFIPHFVFPQLDISSSSSVASHELSHAMVAHLNLPIWLDEGIAVNMEATITGYNPFRLTQQKQAKHLAFWNCNVIQEFWSGDSFSRPDEGNELSYQLAQLIVRSLGESQEAFYPFVKHANREDAGESALQKYYGVSLGDIIENVYGEGEWAPVPKQWDKQ